MKPERNEDFVRCAELLRQRALEVCQHLIPGGKIEGHEYTAGDIDGTPGNSLSVNLSTGIWADFAGSDELKGDLLNLWARVHRTKPVDAMKQAQAWLGISTGDEHTTAGRVVKPTPAPAPATAAPAAAAPKAAPPDQDALRERQKDPPDAKWVYSEADGTHFVTTYRWNALPGRGLGKIVRPWDGMNWKMPEGPRPMLYLADAMTTTAPIVICEGEKTCDALRAAGFVATTNAGGSSTVSKTDWTPLRGKDVVIWADNDPAGVKFAAALTAILRDMASSVRAVKIPKGKPQGWDAADAPELERRNLVNEAIADTPVYLGRRTADLMDLGVKSLKLPPPEREWLIENIMPLSVPAVLAAEGDTGKGMLILHMAMTIAATPRGAIDTSIEQRALGGRICQHGTVVIYSAEDDGDEIARRVMALDPHKERLSRCGDRLKIVPLPDFGGAAPLFERGERGAGADPTEEWERVWSQLQRLVDNGHDIKLIVFDPLSTFASVDMTGDQQAVAQIMGALAQMATVFKATVLVVHHVTKASSGTAELNRSAIKGAGAIVDNVRLAYQLAKVPETAAKNVFKQLSEPYRPDAVVLGGVTKSNAPASRMQFTFVRHPGSGLLIDRTAELARRQHPKQELMLMLEAEVRAASDDGRPFSIDSLKRSVDETQSRRREMAPAMRQLKPSQMQTLIDEAIGQNLLTAIPVRGSNKITHLDVPGGQFTQPDAPAPARGRRPVNTEPDL
jgi:5S rRNA maturation endonuclease (ribonuclease M5)